MSTLTKFVKTYLKEVTYQLLIIIVLFLFFSYHQDSTRSDLIYALFEFKKIAFFGNYIVAATFINYVLLPKFYYRNKKGWFFLTVLILIVVVIMVDEYVLEQIYYPDTRGTYFPGIVFTLVETLPLIIITVAFKFAWDSNKKQGEIQKLKSLVNDSELEFLKLQINPHFLFNNLNNLYSYAITDSSKTPNFILEFSSVLRYMLYDCRENLVSISKELIHLKNYTALNELQISERGVVNYIEKIESSDFLISPLILVVFIENAFKHSSETQSNDIQIDIELHVLKEGKLVFECRNNYMTGYKSGKHSGIGLENVKKRLSLLYPDKHVLDIKNDSCEYRVKLELELIPK